MTNYLRFNGCEVRIVELIIELGRFAPLPCTVYLVRIFQRLSPNHQSDNNANYETIFVLPEDSVRATVCVDTPSEIFETFTAMIINLLIIEETLSRTISSSVVSRYLISILYNHVESEP